MTRRVVEMAGQRFGKVEVIERVPSPRQRNLSPSYLKQVWWKYQCDCGKTKIAPGRLFRDGSITSCGCARDCPSERHPNAIPLGLIPNDWRFVSLHDRGLNWNPNTRWMCELGSDGYSSGGVGSSPNNAVRDAIKGILK